MSFQPPGTPIPGGGPVSPLQLQLMSKLHLTKAQFEQLGTTYPLLDGQLLTLKEDVPEHGLVRGVLYLRYAGIWIAAAGGKHFHNGDNETAGGWLSDVFLANFGKIALIERGHPTVGQFMETGTGAAANDPANGRVTLTTGNTNGLYKNLSCHGIGIDWGRNISFGFKGYFTGGSSFISARMGVACEDVNDPHDDTKKFGIEACDSAGTQRKLALFTASGGANSRTAIESPGEFVSQSAERYYRMDYTVAQDVKLFINGSTVPDVTKNSGVPASGFTTGIRNASLGVKTNTTNVPKTAYLYGMKVFGSVGDNRWM